MTHAWPNPFQLTEDFIIDEVKEMPGDIVRFCLQKAQDLKAVQGHIKFEGHFATILCLGSAFPSIRATSGLESSCSMLVSTLMMVLSRHSLISFAELSKRSCLNKLTPVCWLRSTGWWSHLKLRIDMCKWSMIKQHHRDLIRCRRTGKNGNRVMAIIASTLHT